MFDVTESLEDEYRRVLKRAGYVPPALEDWASAREHFVGASEISPSDIPLEAAAVRAIVAGTPPVNAEIIALGEEVVAGASEWEGMDLVHPALCRVCPGVDYNAEVRRVKGGALLLINEGLIYFVYHCLEIWARADEFPLQGEDQTLSDEEARDHVARATVAYYQGMPALRRRGEMFPLLGGGRGHLIAELCRSAARFVVAHEYGHLYAGHLSSPPAPRTPPRGLDEIPPHWQQEYRADVLAFRTIFPPSMRHTDSDPLSPIRLAGPSVFFVLGELVTRVIDIIDCAIREVCPTLEERMQRTLESGHPPTILRRQHFRKWLESIRGVHLSGLGDQFAAWFDSRMEQLVCDAATLAVRASSK